MVFFLVFFFVLHNLFSGLCFPGNLRTLARYIFLGALFRSELFCLFRLFVLVVIVFSHLTIPSDNL